MTNTELLKAAPVAANRAAPAVAARRPVVAAPNQDPWAGVKTIVEIGFAVVRVVEIAILFA
jgi:hypothetical protein